MIERSAREIVDGRLYRDGRIVREPDFFFCVCVWLLIGLECMEGLILVTDQEKKNPLWVLYGPQI